MKENERAIYIVFTEHMSEQSIKGFLAHFLEMGFTYKKESDDIYKLLTAKKYFEELNEYILQEEKRGCLIRLPG